MSSSPRARAALTISTLVLLVVSMLARAADVESTIAGRVLDATSGEPVEGASIVVTWPAPADGSAARKETRTTGADGTWEVTGVPAGTYAVRIEKSGFKPAQIARFVVRPGESPRADLNLNALSATEPEMPSGVEEFVVVGTKAEAIEASRESSDQLLNTLSAEEFSKFAASDVADALRFVPGVNVVKGQFAIIRGLEDRYSSTLYNGAPIPSPDPDRQSVPLDLFPSEVVTNLVVAKTFASDLPSNSSGGSINIISHDYPETLEIKVTAGSSLNSNARDEFINFDGGSSVGRETSGLGNALGGEFGLSIAGRAEPNEREVRYKLVLNSEVKHGTATGFQEGLEPAQRSFSPAKSGDLSLGKLSLSDGRFDLTDSDKEAQLLEYGGFGFDIDQQGNHKVDVSAFYVKKKNKAVELKDNGFLPGYDYAALATKQAAGDDIQKNSDFEGFATPSSWIARTVRAQPNEPVQRGPMWYSSFSNSTSFDQDRDLLVTQIGGDHTLEALEGLHVTWAGNYAKTTQDEQSRGTRIFFEPTDPNVIPARVPPGAESLGSGQFTTPNGGILFSTANVNEHQYFGRLDADYQADVMDQVALKLSAGGWYENAQRRAEASYLQNPQIVTSQCEPECAGGGTNFVFFGDTANRLGHIVFNDLRRDTNGDYTSLRLSTNDSSREISAGYLGAKTTLWDQVDLLGGMRLEHILIKSNNDPFTGEISPINHAPTIFPTSFLMFERLDNPALGEVVGPPPPGTVYNDELLGLKVPVNPATGTVDLLTRGAIESLVNGKIDETKLLPSAGIAYRPPDVSGLVLRGAYSQTAARPSFREIGYYVSVEPGSDDLIVGNPQLKLSDVESYDMRAEYNWGDIGDLVALSAFYKRIDDPIESIVIRDPVNKDGTNSALYRTFFNNPNVARLWGLEAEGRENLGFTGYEFAQFFSVGANFTYIDAKVGRTQAELARSTRYFGVAAGDAALYLGLKPTRRLFGQPEWIANADLTFDQPDWGTKATLAFFAISDVLDAAGAANLNANNQVYSYTLDRYVDSFSRLDLIVSQIVHANFLGSDVIFKISAKNLTDTTRRLIYDPGQTSSRLPERSYKLGREFKFTVTWAF
jgi:TonB-dependent receptor